MVIKHTHCRHSPHPFTLALLIAATFLCACNGNRPPVEEEYHSSDTAAVYITRDISPASLVRIYRQLGLEAHGNVAVKISTGEGDGNHYLKPELIGDLVKLVHGTIVECNCAYPGTRDATAEHLETARKHGFFTIADVDIMDAEGDMRLPVRDTTHIPYNLVGSHLARYDFLIDLAHFKGHQMAGYGGAIKNLSIGVASANGKALIHTAGKRQHSSRKIAVWSNAVAATKQDHFCESMAASAQAVADYFAGRILYINVMNNLSIDCDCNPRPKKPQIQDVGILASLDPVALDQACLDIIFRMPADSLNNPEPLIKRIHSRNGTHTVAHAERIGLGTRNYRLVSID